MAVLHPLKLIITNYPAHHVEKCTAACHPHHSTGRERDFPFSRELWIEQDDFQENPPKKYFRLFPGNTVRLKYAFVIRCTGYIKDKTGQIIEVHAEYLPDTKSGTPGADRIKIKGTLTWVSAQHAQPVQVHLYERLFLDPNPEAGDKDFLNCLNPNSKQTLQGWLEPGIQAHPEAVFQFERLGYFVADSKTSQSEAPVVNQIVTLRDTWTQGNQP